MRFTGMVPGSTPRSGASDPGPGTSARLAPHAKCKPAQTRLKADTLRVLSAVLALTVLVGAWLGFEMLDRADRPQPAVPTPAPEAAIGAAPSAPAAIRAPDDGQVHIPAPPAAAPGAIHKCTVAGQVVYADQPCAGGAGRQLALPADSAGLAPQRSYQQQLRDIEPARRQRLAREQEYEAERRRLAATTPDKSLQCAEIDRAVAGIDAILRQPYGPEFGDRKKAERKALMDRRFSLGC